MALETSLNKVHRMMRGLHSPPKMVEAADDTVIWLASHDLDEAAMSAVDRLEFYTAAELVKSIEAIAEFVRATEER